VQKYSDGVDAYTDPKTGVLKNKLGLTTEKDLERAEVSAASLRANELDTNPIAGDFDLPHLKAIHQRLFGDVYQWAGKTRTVDISKGETRFAHHGRIEAEAKKLTDQLKHEQYLRGLSADEFSQRAGHYMGELNVIHPFREGNGRSLRVYIGQIAKQAGYEIKWENIDRKDMTQASIEAYHGSSERIARLIRENLVDRSQHSAASTTAPGIEKKQQPLPQGIDAQRAAAFRDSPIEAVKKHPELAGAAATIAAIEKKVQADGLNAEQHAAVMARVHENVANSIERGQLPEVKVRESVETKREAQKELSR